MVSLRCASRCVAFQRKEVWLRLLQAGQYKECAVRLATWEAEMQLVQRTHIPSTITLVSAANGCESSGRHAVRAARHVRSRRLG